MEKHLSSEEIAFYAEYLSDPTKKTVPENIRAHIQKCNKCASEAAELSIIIENTSLPEMPVYDSRIKKKRHIRMMYAAASILLIIGIWFGLSELNQGKNYRISVASRTISKDTLHIKKPNKPKPQPDDRVKNETLSPVDNPDEANLLRQNFKPHPVTEKLAERYRKGSLRGDDFKMISKPSIEIKTDGNFSLKWENPEEAELTAELFDNKAESVSSCTSSGNSCNFNIQLKAGLYYYKIYNSDFDLLFCGKIIKRKE